MLPQRLPDLQEVELPGAIDVAQDLRDLHRELPLLAVSGCASLGNPLRSNSSATGVITVGCTPGISTWKKTP